MTMYGNVRIDSVADTVKYDVFHRFWVPLLYTPAFEPRSGRLHREIHVEKGTDLLIFLHWRYISDGRITRSVINGKA